MLYLMCKGYRILGHRLRTPYGEVDVAAWNRGVLVIVEVKARNTYDAGAYAVTPHSATAHRARGYKRSRVAGGSTQAPVRFDLVVVGSGLLPRHERAAWYDERPQRRWL